MSQGSLGTGRGCRAAVRSLAPPPAWSAVSDQWATETLERGDPETLLNYRHRASAIPYAHPTADHLVPLFVTMGAAAGHCAAPDFIIDGSFIGLPKQSLQVA